MTTTHPTNAASASTSISTERSETGWLPLAILLAGIFLVVLDFFIVNVALPSMQRDLGASDTDLEWVVAGFGLTYGGLLLAASRLGDRWGRRRMYGAGVGLFVLASAICGLAQSPEVLIIGRLAQGAAGAMATPMVLALINEIYSGARRVRAIGAYSIAMGIAAAAGQLIGGLLIHLDLFGLGWRSIFLVNVPVGLVIVALLRRLPLAKVAVRAPDPIELILATTMLVALTLPLLEGRRLGWPIWTFVSLGAAVVLADLLVLRGRALLRRGGDPLLGVVLRGDRVLGLGLIRQFVLFLGMASFFLILALHTQGERGLGALSSGAMFLFVAIPYLIGTGQAPRLLRRWPRWAGVASALVFLDGHLLALVAVEWRPYGSVLWLAPGMAIAGLGMGLCLTSQIQSLMATAAPTDAGAVSGMMSSAQQLGNTLGVALVGMLYFGAGGAAGFAHGLTYLIGVLALLALLGVARPARVR